MFVYMYVHMDVSYGTVFVYDTFICMYGLYFSPATRLDHHKTIFIVLVFPSAVATILFWTHFPLENVPVGLPSAEHSWTHHAEMDMWLWCQDFGRLM